MQDDQTPAGPHHGRQLRTSAGKQFPHGKGQSRVTLHKWEVLKELRRRLRQLIQERDELHLVVHINKLLLNNLDPEQLFTAISSALWERTHHHYMTLSTLEPTGATERLRLLDFPRAPGRLKIGDQVPESLERVNLGLDTNQISVLGPERIATLQPPDLARLNKQEGIQSICLIPLFSRGRALGVMSLGSLKEHSFGAATLHLLELVAGQVALALDNAMAFQDIRHSRDKLVEEKLYLEEERAQDFSTQEMVGSSPSFSKILWSLDSRTQERPRFYGAFLLF
ncbi:MAG: GAF domain-containing protein [Acidobacteriota bacterium]|nr:GAF domain-containing protein [Acidobacteriota bacterium]